MEDYWGSKGDDGAGEAKENGGGAPAAAPAVVVDDDVEMNIE